MKTRNFVSTNITESMFMRRFRTGNYVLDPIKTEADIEELKNLPLISCVRNKGVLGTLGKMGIQVKEQAARIDLDETDTLFVISAEGEELLKFRDSDALPDYINLKVSVYRLKERIEVK